MTAIRVQIGTEARVCVAERWTNEHLESFVGPDRRITEGIREVERAPSTIQYINYTCEWSAFCKHPRRQTLDVAVGRSLAARSDRRAVASPPTDSPATGRTTHPCVPNRTPSRAGIEWVESEAMRGRVDSWNVQIVWKLWPRGIGMIQE